MTYARPAASEAAPLPLTSRTLSVEANPTYLSPKRHRVLLSGGVIVAQLESDPGENFRYFLQGWDAHISGAGARSFRLPVGSVGGHLWARGYAAAKRYAAMGAAQ